MKACRDMIKQTLKSTQKYICEGQDLLGKCESRQVDEERCLKYFDQSSLLGRSALHLLLFSQYHFAQCLLIWSISCLMYNLGGLGLQIHSFFKSVKPTCIYL